MACWTAYEWDIETTDEYGDIQDHAHSDAPDIPRAENEHLVLVRDVGDEMGLSTRAWAYAEQRDGQWILPDEFDNGVRVPKRFHEALAKAQ